MQRLIVTTAALCLIGSALAASPLPISSDTEAIGPSVQIAEGQGQNKGKGPQQGAGQGQGGPPAGKGNGKFADDHRSIIVGYYQQEYYGRGSCPPGLAKKNNGCMPPGQANKLYAVGQPWPPTLVFQPLPGPLLGRIGPPPPGYGYGYYGGDVIMYALAGLLVVDIVVTLGR